MLTYRVFCPESELEKLPADIVVQERYPAFSIVSASTEAIEAVRKICPVESWSPPVGQAPAAPANVAGAMSATQKKKRGPYTKVVRFRYPVQSSDLAELEKIGCQVREAIGDSSVVVSCPNKPSVAKLQTLPKVAQVEEHIPTIRLTPEFFDDLGIEANESALADAVASLASSDSKSGSTSNLSVPGVLLVSFFTPQDKQRAERRLRREGIRDLVEVGESRLGINLTSSADPMQAVETIMTLQGLRSLDEKKMNRLFNNVARDIIAQGVVTSNPSSLGLTGRGEIVAVADSGLDTGEIATIHADFQGRVRDIQSWPITSLWSDLLTNPNADDGAADIYSGHGTHVCGSVLGNGTRSRALNLEPIEGVAPEAELVFQAIDQTMPWTPWAKLWWLRRVGRTAPPNGLYGIPDDLNVLFQAAYDQGARIHSNSWGGGTPGEYDDQCEDLDQFVWQHKDFLILVAAGNDGVDLRPVGDGIDPGSVSSPGTAKNCVTVGASENGRSQEFSYTYGEFWPDDYPAAPFRSDRMLDSIDDIASFSSRGPCTTGRRKPDVVAPGTYVLSTRSSQIPDNNFAWAAFARAKWDYMYMGGTSMATPLVAGAAAIVRQYLREKEGINNPTAALLKATLIHSARYLRYRYAHPSSSAWADNEQGWGRVDLQQTLNPDSPAAVLFVDATQGLQTGQQREFNVEVSTSSLPLRIIMVYSDYPGEKLVNNLNLIAYDPNGNYILGNDFAGSGIPDALNNVEGIVAEDPAPGVWSIRIVASEVPKGPQDFALVISGAGLHFAEEAGCS